MIEKIKETYGNGFKDKQGRIAIELDFPVVRRNQHHFGEAARDADICNLIERISTDDPSWALSSDGLSVSKKVRGCVVRIGAEFSSVLEVKLPMVRTLMEAEQSIADVLIPIARASEKTRVSVLAYGSQPRSKANDEMLLENGRNMAVRQKLNNKMCYLGIVASEKINIGVSNEEMPLVNNVLNYYSPAIIALTANSAIIKGRDAGYLDYREAVSEMVNFKSSKLRSLNSGRRGMMRAFNSAEEHIDSILPFTPLFTVRDERLLAYVDARSMKEYYEKGYSEAVDMGTGERLRITPEPVDFQCHECTCWTAARPMSSYGTVELRAVSMQSSVAEMVAAGALAMGLAAAAKEAWSAIGYYSFEDLETARKEAMKYGSSARIRKTRGALSFLAEDMLDIASEGLRSVNETADYLEPLYKNLKQEKSPAHRSLEFLGKNGLLAFIDSVRLKE